MGNRYTKGWEDHNANIRTKLAKMDIDNNPSGAGSIPAAMASYVTATEKSDGILRRTTLTLSAVPITVRDTEQGGGVKVYDMPACRILTLGGSGSIAVTTTSALATTLNASKTGNWGVGSATQSNSTLATTEQNFVNVTNFTSSATINVAGAASDAVGIGIVTPLDGTSTPVDVFLNLAVDTAEDIDGDATVTVSGTIHLTWINLGPY